MKCLFSYIVIAKDYKIRVIRHFFGASLVNIIINLFVSFSRIIKQYLAQWTAFIETRYETNTITIRLLCMSNLVKTFKPIVELLICILLKYFKLNYYSIIYYYTLITFSMLEIWWRIINNFNYIRWVFHFIFSPYCSSIRLKPLLRQGDILLQCSTACHTY